VLVVDPLAQPGGGDGQVGPGVDAVGNPILEFLSKTTSLVFALITYNEETALPN